MLTNHLEEIMERAEEGVNIKQSENDCLYDHFLTFF